MLKDALLVSFCLLVFVSAISQQTASFTYKKSQFIKAIELYQNGQFLAAQNMFSSLKEETDDESIISDCSYYIANCAVNLNQQNADLLMEQFVKDHPASPKRNNAFTDVANYYFEKGDYSYARKWLDLVKPDGLSLKDREKYHFYNGYTYFKNKRYGEAKNQFNRVINSAQYGSEAKYYLGYIAYEGDDYEEANEYFEEVEGDDRYQKELSYYQADMNFKLGRFQKAITLALEQYDRSSQKEKSELSKIIGESYFNLGKYAESIPYLKEYKGRRGKWNNTDHYQLGYAYYKQSDFENAINVFNKIIDGDNDIAQNAFYHLAESYLKLNRKQEALNAFKNASEMDFDRKIQEDSALNYAKLGYEIGNNYESVSMVLQNVIDTYPDNDQIGLLNELLIDSYITSKNYKAAVELLENRRSERHRAVYQKVTFLRGLELFSENLHHNAILHFDKSLGETIDPVISARATFWRGESNYQLSDYVEALIDFEKFVQMRSAYQSVEYRNVNYHLAYTEFKLKNYREAIAHFKEFIINSNPKREHKLDACLRLGDCLFVSRKYNKAIEYYDQAIDLSRSNNDYAQYQKAISYGFLGQIQKKINSLNTIVENNGSSVYRDDALFELGNTYGSRNENEKAIRAYDRIINKIPGSGYVARSLLKKALILNNSGSGKEALSLFKRVANDFSSSSEAVQAVASAKNIYIELGRVEEYGAWVDTLDFIDLEDSELDEAAFLAAEQPYLENDTNTALIRLENYNQEFLKGINSLKAHFYLAQIYFDKKEPNKAVAHYDFVISKSRNEFTEQALARISQLYLEKKDYSKAIPYLIDLEKEAEFQQNILFARSNIMKANYEMEHYSDAKRYAELLLNDPELDNAVRNDAMIITARSAMKTGDEEKARKAYDSVSTVATGKLAAEALYFKAYFKNMDANYNESNTLIQQLANEHSVHKYFGAKGLILMADNFYKLNDAYQATYILESVIDNFPDYPDLINEAKTNLELIKKNESKTNSSIETDDEN